MKLPFWKVRRASGFSTLLPQARILTVEACHCSSSAAGIGFVEEIERVWVFMHERGVTDGKKDGVWSRILRLLVEYGLDYVSISFARHTELLYSERLEYSLNSVEKHSPSI